MFGLRFLRFGFCGFLGFRWFVGFVDFVVLLIWVRRPLGVVLELVFKVFGFILCVLFFYCF